MLGLLDFLDYFEADLNEGDSGKPSIVVKSGVAPQPLVKTQIQLESAMDAGENPMEVDGSVWLAANRAGGNRLLFLHNAVLGAEGALRRF